MNCLDGIHYSVILINFELMNLHELMLTKYSPRTTSENTVHFDLQRSLSRTFQTALRIVTVSVYYGSSNQFSLYKI